MHAPMVVEFNRYDEGMHAWVRSSTTYKYTTKSKNICTYGIVQQGSASRAWCYGRRKGIDQVGKYIGSSVGFVYFYVCSLDFKILERKFDMYWCRWEPLKQFVWSLIWGDWNRVSKACIELRIKKWSFYYSIRLFLWLYAQYDILGADILNHDRCPW